MLPTILRLPAVKSESGLSRSTIYLRITQGLWTKPVSLGPRAVGWPSGDVVAINAARIASKTEEEIRTLVVYLEAARKTAGQGQRRGGIYENSSNSTTSESASIRRILPSHL